MRPSFTRRDFIKGGAAVGPASLFAPAGRRSPSIAWRGRPHRPE